MKYSEVIFFLSSPRMQRFLDATGSKTKAVKLYKANLRIAQSIHPLLGILEVILRNRLNDILSTHFADNNWILNQTTGFMSDSSLKYKHKRTGQIRTNNFLKKGNREGSKTH